MNSGASIALFTRSLREDNRLKQTYVARGGLVCFILVLLVQAQSSYRYSGSPGLNIFSQVIYTNFFFISLTGLSYFASAVAEEKEETTLGLLRMTDLGPLSILLGKSTSRLCGVFLLLLVQLPFTLLAVTLGGVSIGQVLAAYCTLGAYIFFLCNLALLFSVMCSRVGAASALTGATVLAFFFGPPMGLGILSWLSKYHSLDPGSALAKECRGLFQWMEGASVFNYLGTILRTGFAEPPMGYPAWCNLAMGVGCFLLAWLGFDFFTRDQKEATPGRSFVFRRTSRLGALGAGRAWSRAVLWKDFYFQTGGFTGLAAKTIFYFLLTLFFTYLMLDGRRSSYTPYWEQLGWSMVSTFSLILGFELAFSAARMFRAEIQWKTLSGLFGLPATIRSIAYQKATASLLSALPAAAFLGVGILLALSGGDHFHRAITDGDFWVAGFSVAAQSTLFLHLTAYLSLRLKRLALPAALALVYFGNMFAILGASIVFRLFSGGGSGSTETIITLYHCGLLVLAGVIHRSIGGRLARLAAEES